MSSPPSIPAASQIARYALAKYKAQVAANLTHPAALQNLGPGSIALSQRRACIATRTSTPISTATETATATFESTATASDDAIA